ncbi:MAG: 30S ribosomal protein S8 [Candidatus Hydrothermales bacterium]
MVNDPIGDTLIRIKNAALRKKEKVVTLHSKLLVKIAEILKNEGFIKSYEVKGEGVKKELVIYLKYDEEGNPLITDVKRVSKPGRRIYVTKDKIPWVNNGIGIAILSTSKGLLTDREARRLKVGGEVLCEVW